MAKRGTTYLNVEVTEQDFERAREGGEAHSERCMIALAIRRQHGPSSHPIADTDYIRLTAPNGDRLLYRTPAMAQAALLSFDAGVKPALPLRFRAHIAYQQRARRRNETPLYVVRAWAKGRDDLPAVGPRGRVPGEVIDAYLAANPGKRIAPQRSHRVSTSASRVMPKTVVPNKGKLPPVANLAGGSSRGTNKIPLSRRRTWGSRQLTSVLIEQGWAAPDE